MQLRHALHQKHCLWHGQNKGDQGMERLEGNMGVGGWGGGLVTFSLAAKEAPIATQSSALVIISGVQDT